MLERATGAGEEAAKSHDKWWGFIGGHWGARTKSQGVYGGQDPTCFTKTQNLRARSQQGGN